MCSAMISFNQRASVCYNLLMASALAYGIIPYAKYLRIIERALCVFACTFACFQESDLHRNVVVVTVFRFVSLRKIPKLLSVQIIISVGSCHRLLSSLLNLNMHLCISSSLRSNVLSCGN